MAALALSGLLGLRRFMGRKALMDERDQMIAARASLTGFGAFYLIAIMAVVIVILARGGDAVLHVPVWCLGLLAYAAMFIVYVGWSVYTIVQYRRGQ